MLWTRQQVGASHALWVARVAPNLHQMLPFRVKFDATHHPHHGDEVRVCSRDAEER
jgi:hypothetical protein